MFPSLCDDVPVKPEDGPHAGKPVRRHVNSMTAPAKKDSPRGCILCNLHRNFLGNIDIVIRRIKPMSANILPPVSPFHEPYFDLFLQRIPPPICSKNYFH